MVEIDPCAYHAGLAKTATIPTGQGNKGRKGRTYYTRYSLSALHPREEKGIRLGITKPNLKT